MKYLATTRLESGANLKFFLTTETLRLLSLYMFSDNALGAVRDFRLDIRFDHMKYKMFVQLKLIDGRF